MSLEEKLKERERETCSRATYLQKLCIYLLPEMSSLQYIKSGV
jgi:hypothetical protein